MSRFEAQPGIVTNGLVLNLDAGDPDSYTRSQPPYVEVLVVAGGGGGGGNSSNNFRTGGGGGAGGVIFNSAYQLTNASPITVTIGAGGAGEQRQANSGNNSIFGSLTAIGGGGGGGTTSTGDQNGLDGGSGGGGGDYNGNGGNRTVGQGFNGGNSRQANGSGAGASGGGGGGAGGNGPDAINTYSAQNGGASVTYSISGTSVAYAAGGGVRSCSPIDNDVGTDGAANTGTGGQGARFNRGGNGGSGIVIVRYPGLPAATGGTIIYVNGYTIHKFTSSGTFTPYLWNDISGNSNDGTLTNGPTFNPLLGGGTLVFDGVDDYSIGNLPSINSSHTVLMWIYAPDGLPTITGSSTGRVTPLKGNGQWNPGIWLGNNKLRGHSSGKYVDYTYMNWTIADWHMIGQVWDGSTLTLVADGTFVTPNSTTNYSPGVPSQVIIGAESTTGQQPFDGYIPTVQIYNRALSQSEVEQNFYAQKDRFDLDIITDRLQVYLDASNPESYPGTGTTWYDISGQGNDFTFSATPKITGQFFDNEGSVYAYRNALGVDSSVKGYTLEALFKINSSLNSSWQNVIQNGGSDPNRQMMWYNGGSNSFQALFHTPNSYNNISDTLSFDTWYYLQLSYNPNQWGNNGRRAWLNGVEKTVNNTGVGDSVADGNFTVGIDNNLSTGQSDMSYAFVRYYDRALNEDEVRRNYFLTKARFDLP